MKLLTLNKEFTFISKYIPCIFGAKLGINLVPWQTSTMNQETEELSFLLLNINISVIGASLFPNVFEHFSCKNFIG